MFSYMILIYEVSNLMRNDSLLAPMMLTYILVYRSCLHLFYQYNVSQLPAGLVDFKTEA